MQAVVYTWRNERDTHTANELGAREREILNLAVFFFFFANEFEGENTEGANLILWIEQMEKTGERRLKKYWFATTSSLAD